MTRYFDVLAYGVTGREGLSHYLETKNDIEHILAQGADEDGKLEFGEGADDNELIQRLGNLMLVELSVNRVIQNRPYSEKIRSILPRSFYWLDARPAPAFSRGQRQDHSGRSATRPRVTRQPGGDRAAIEMDSGCRCPCLGFGYAGGVISFARRGGLGGSMTSAATLWALTRPDTIMLVAATCTASASSDHSRPDRQLAAYKTPDAEAPAEPPGGDPDFSAS